MDELKRSMELIEVSMELEGELRRIEAMRYCIKKGYMEHIDDALEVMEKTLKKCREKVNMVEKGL